jgi:hypothetical protein
MVPDNSFLDKLADTAAASIIYALIFSAFDLWRWWRRNE